MMELLKLLVSAPVEKLTLVSCILMLIAVILLLLVIYKVIRR